MRLKDLGKTQGWLAENIKTADKPSGLSINAISKWTKTGKIAREHVQQVADLLEITADQLLAGSPLIEQVPIGETTIERLAADEKHLLDLYRGSTQDGKSGVIGMATLAPKLPVRSLRRPSKT